MVTITESWRQADKARKEVTKAMERATLAAVAGDADMAWLNLHAARRSAEALALHLEEAANDIRATEPATSSGA
jgi:hypothetical protein